MQLIFSILAALLPTTSTTSPASAVVKTSAPVTMALPPAQVPDRPTVLVVIGAEGTSDYARDFATWADRWRDAAERGSAKFVEIGRGAAGAASGGDKQRLQAVLTQESGASATATAPTTAAATAVSASLPPLWVVLIGHGTYDGREAKFNLRDDDVSAAELSEWLKGCRRPLAVIDCTSASAPFLNRLSGAGRVVITATRSGTEIQYARFGEHISASITDAAADLDKDGQTSLLESFLAASHRVEEFYKQEARLATEHALLDDNGDGLGVAANWFQGVRATRAARDGAPIDGARAHQWHLVRTAADEAMAADVRARRDALELQVETLRRQKATLMEADYYARLEPLLLDLARLYQDPQTAPRPPRMATPATMPATMRPRR